MSFWKKFQRKKERLIDQLEKKGAADPAANRLLFLDFDGVFLSASNDPRVLMGNIMTFVQEYDFHLVIASSWRTHPETAYKTLKKSGCTAVIEGKTPFLSGPRYREIADYLMKHPFSEFFILDDLDMGPLRTHAVRTELIIGFNQEKLEEAQRKMQALLQRKER